MEIVTLASPIAPLVLAASALAQQFLSPSAVVTVAVLAGRITRTVTLASAIQLE